MKKNLYLSIFIICYVFMLLCVSCKQKESKSETQFTAKPIVKTINNINIIIDPNIELMMILARLGQLTPYYKGFRETNDYIDEIDEYFGKFDLEPAVGLVGRSGLIYEKLPEFAMYMNGDSTGFKII